MIRRLISILTLSCACGYLQAQDYYIKTIAGIDTFGFAGDGGSAIDCEFYGPEGFRLDGYGNMYIADLGNDRIRKINLSAGIITTIAGDGNFGYNGDNISATDAYLNEPPDVATDSDGNVFIADGFNNRIRKVAAASEIITTVAGTGSIGSSGDNGAAISATFNDPVGLAIDNAQNIIVADYYNNKVRKIDHISGIITTIAGTGIAGDTGYGGPATLAELNGPINVFTDSLGNVFISDQWNNQIHKVDIATGIITNVAGTGSTGYTGNGGLAIDAQLNQPGGGFFDKQGNLYFADYGNGAIRKIDAATGIITTIAGNGTFGYGGDYGPATEAELKPTELQMDASGVIYIADYGNNRIRVLYSPLAVSPSPVVPDIAIYPNPVSSVLNIEHAKGYHLSLSNILGTEVLSASITSDKSEVDISSLPAGVYAARFTNECGNTVTEKIVKE